MGLQTPSIELVIDAKDASGEKDSALFGFKRYTAVKGENRMKDLQAILDSGAKRAEDGDTSSAELDAFLTKEILYIKKLVLKTEDTLTGKKELMKIEDTRTAKPVDGFWGTGVECLSVLVGYYIESSPWKTSLITGVMKAILNNDYEEALAKN